MDEVNPSYEFSQALLGLVLDCSKRKLLSQNKVSFKLRELFSLDWNPKNLKEDFLKTVVQGDDWVRTWVMRQNQTVAKRTDTAYIVSVPYHCDQAMSCIASVPVHFDRVKSHIESFHACNILPFNSTLLRLTLHSKFHLRNSCSLRPQM